mgnify:CR=1 FL=1
MCFNNRCFKKIIFFNLYSWKFLSISSENTHLKELISISSFVKLLTFEFFCNRQRLNAVFCLYCVKPRDWRSNFTENLWVRASDHMYLCSIFISEKQIHTVCHQISKATKQHIIEYPMRVVLLTLSPAIWRKIFSFTDTFKDVKRN